LLPHAPAIGTFDKNSSERVLALDRVRIDFPSLSVYVNHDFLNPSVAGDYRPKFLNVLYGDGPCRAMTAGHTSRSRSARRITLLLRWRRARLFLLGN